MIIINWREENIWFLCIVNKKISFYSRTRPQSNKYATRCSYKRRKICVNNKMKCIKITFETCFSNRTEGHFNLYVKLAPFFIRILLFLCYKLRNWMSSFVKEYETLGQIIDKNLDIPEKLLIWWSNFVFISSFCSLSHTSLFTMYWRWRYIWKLSDKRSFWIIWQRWQKKITTNQWWVQVICLP